MKKGYLTWMALLGAMSLSAQNSLPDAIAFKVKSEAFGNSKIEELSSFMTDDLGPRLAASQLKLRAEQLVVGKLSEL